MKNAGIGPSELARETGIARSTINRMKRGDDVGTIYSWRMVASALGMTVSELLGE